MMGIIACFLFPVIPVSAGKTAEQSIGDSLPRELVYGDNHRSAGFVIFHRDPAQTPAPNAPPGSGTGILAAGGIRMRIH